jgi:hypothetical protein
VSETLIEIRRCVIRTVCVLAGGHSHSCGILYEPETPPALHQEDTEESCR